MDKRRYFTRKVLNAVLTIVLVACFNFMLFRILPGNPARLLLPKGHYSPEAIAQQMRIFHLDKPLWQQFGYYWVDTLKGNFGNSYAQHEPVITVVGRAIIPTLVLVGIGTALATVIGVVVGVLAGWRRNHAFDIAATNLGMIFYSMPTFWVAMLFILYFSVKLGWFPSGRMTDVGALYASFAGRALAFLHHLFLPAFVFAITYAAEYELIMRSSITGVMKEDFALTARAKGLSESKVLWKSRGAQRHAALCDPDHDELRLRALRRDSCRDGLQLAGLGPALLQLDAGPRLPGDAGRVSARSRGRDPLQLDRRHHVLLPRPAGEGMSAPPVPARLKRWTYFWTPLVWTCLELITFPKDRPLSCGLTHVLGGFVSASVASYPAWTDARRGAGARRGGARSPTAAALAGAARPPCSV